MIGQRTSEPAVTEGLRVRDVVLSFGGIHALDGVSLTVEAGATVGIIGPNGAGKTSLLNCLNGFYKPQSGSITFDGHSIVARPPHRIARLGISRTFQSMELVQEATVLDNIMLGRHIRMKRGLLSGAFYWGATLREETEHRTAVERVIKFLEIEPLRHREVATLSAGQQKLIGLARAIATEPHVLLLDEPSAGMNREERYDVARFLLRVKHETETAQVLIEHDIRFVRDICDYVYVLDFGQVIGEGPPSEVLKDPRVMAAYSGGAA